MGLQRPVLGRRIRELGGWREHSWQENIQSRRVQVLGATMRSNDGDEPRSVVHLKLGRWTMDIAKEAFA